MELTSAQWALLLGLVARASSQEEARVARMEARPPGSHEPDKLQAARLLRDDLVGLEEAVKEAAQVAASGSLSEPQEHTDPEECTLVYQGHVAAPGYGVAYECEVCGRPWLKIGSGWADPRERVYELSPEDVV